MLDAVEPEANCSMHPKTLRKMQVAPGGMVRLSTKRGSLVTKNILNEINLASEIDWSTEYLDSILSIIVVSECSEAIKHISKYGSGHTDVIVTENKETAAMFLRNVDSSSVMHNASSRFADGYEYGLGAEIGISTNKLHARGPVGIKGLTNEKFIVIGNGNIR